jgi:hypothetical protein
MARSQRHNRWVVFAMPENHTPGGDNLFFARDGSETKSRLRAAKFHSENLAARFATEKGIEIDGAMRYIGRLDFAESELGDEI